MAINTGKVLTGGLAAGVVLAVLDGVVNGVIMAGQNRAAMEALNPALVAGMEGTGVMVGYIAIDLVFGILITWTYAAMRPRFGAGPKTALLVGVQIWLVAILMYVGMTLMGMWPWSYFVTGAALYLVVFAASAYVGGMLYREE